jgi:FRG domain
MYDPKPSVRNYRACREVLRQLSWDSYGDDWGPPMRRLFFSLIKASDPERCRVQAGYGRAIADGLFEKAMVLRDIFVPISDRDDEKTLFRDVYELATYIALSNGGQWEYNPLIPRYFRGQTREWPLVPSILRHCQNSGDLSAAIERLTRFVRSLQGVRSSTTDEQALAIAQHYSSSKNRLWTWLLDVTRGSVGGLVLRVVWRKDRRLRSALAD